MKNQNFGDNRDLLKFDLVYQIARTGLVDQFVYVPMLTEDDPAKKPDDFCRHEATGGGANTELIDFLNDSIVNEKRQVGQIERYFSSCGIKATVYASDTLFTENDRKSYFEGIPQKLFVRSLILVDPDKGIEDREHDSGNLLLSELQGLYEKMDSESFLVVTQRFPYGLYKEYLAMRVADIKENIPGAQPISIDDLDTILFFMTRSRPMKDRLIQVLQDYLKQYAQKSE